MNNQEYQTSEILGSQIPGHWAPTQQQMSGVAHGGGGGGEEGSKQLELTETCHKIFSCIPQSQSPDSELFTILVDVSFSWA